MKTVFLKACVINWLLKMIFITALVLIFILRLRFPKGKSVADIITNIQSRRPDFYKYTRLPVTRWVKLSLNFELLVPK